MTKRRQMGAKALLREFFLRNVGQVVTAKQLREAAGDVTEWARRVRELRTDEGFEIHTHNDRSDLKPGEYMLASVKPLPVFAAAISKETRAIVLERNGYTCQSCGVAAGEVHPYDNRVTRLHLGHIIDRSKGGTDEPSNLRAVCRVCNEGANNVKPMPPTLKTLLVNVRRAGGGDQLEVLKWLVRKFPTQAEGLIAELRADED